MTPAATGRHDAGGTEQVNQLPQQRLVRGEPFGVEPLIRVLVRAFEIQPGLTDGGNNDPVARQVDGVTVALLDSGQPPAGVRAVQRIARAFAFDHDADVGLVGRQTAEHAISELAIGFDMAFARQAVAPIAAGRRLIAEQLDEQVSQPVGKHLSFPEPIGPTGPHKVGPAR